jgi:hypothetical protein
MPKFRGPFAITTCTNAVTYRLDLPAPMINRRVHNAFHAKLLRPYHPDTHFNRPPVIPAPVQFPDGHTEYEVDQIVRFRLHHGHPQYLVHWAGYGDHENSWVPAADFNCPDLLAEFHRAADGSSTRGGGGDGRFHLSLPRILSTPPLRTRHLVPNSLTVR